MCSLQEAYNVPSFDPNGLRRRRGCTAPIGGNRATQNVYALPAAPRESVAYDGPVEGFTDGVMYSSKGATAYNIPASATNAASYAGRAGDNKYYCDYYNVCPPEHFTAAPNSAKPPPQKCAPLTAPPYTYPMSDETKRQFDNAVTASLNDVPGQPPTAPTPQPMRKVDMNAVNGYYDEALEQYLQTKDFGTSPKMPPPPRARADQVPPDAFDSKETPFSITMDKLKPTETRGVRPASIMTEADITPKPVSNNKTYLFDVFLFIAAGLLIIFLCDQLFRFGVALGIKETVTLLEPFMEGNKIKFT